MWPGRCQEDAVRYVTYVLWKFRRNLRRNSAAICGVLVARALWSLCGEIHCVSIIAVMIDKVIGVML